MARLEIIREFWDFLLHRKKFYLIPIVVILLILAVIAVFTADSALAPLIYTLF